MSAELVGTKRRWAASAAGAVIVMAVFLMLLRIPRVAPSLPAPRLAAPTAPKVAVQVALPGGSNRVLNDEAAIQDQTALFLPTERNVTFRPPRRPEAGRAVLDQDDRRFLFGEAELKLNLPSAQVVPEKPADVMLTSVAPTPLYGFGRDDRPVPTFPARGAILEILLGDTNRRVLTQALPGDAKPPTERAWRPMEFIARVDAAGLVGPLVIAERSDVEEVDKFFQNYLGQTFRIGERLPPGFYRILVGP